MKAIINRQYQLYGLFVLWFITGFYLGIFASIIIIPSLLLLVKIKEYWWAVIGLIILMIFSDNRNIDLSFAQNLKGAYFILLSILCFGVVKPFQRNPIIQYFALFFIILAICVFRSDILFTAFQKTISYFLLFLVIPAILIYEVEKKGKLPIHELIFFILSILLLSLVLVYVFPEIGKLQMMRWNGFLGNPNGLGIFIVLVYLLFEITKVLYPSLYSRSLKIILYALFLILLYGSGSRGAMLAIFAFWFAKLLMQISVFLGIIGIVFFFIFLNEIYAFTIDFVVYLGYSEELRIETVEQGSGRLVAWNFAWNEIQENTYLLGKGIDHEVYYMQKNYEILSRMGHEGNVHNSYLSFWMNTGLIGLLTFFLPFIWLFFKAHKRNKLALPVMISVMVSINFESWLSASLNPFTILLVIIMTLLLADIFYKEPVEEKAE